MSAIQKWVSDNTLVAMVLLTIAVGGCNYLMTGDVDGKPHQSCLDNPRNNDQQCWADPGYVLDANGDAVPE